MSRDICLLIGEKGRELAERIAREEARNPIGTFLTGTLGINPPPEIGLIGGQIYMCAIFNRLQEIAQIRVTSN